MANKRNSSTIKVFEGPIQKLEILLGESFEDFVISKFRNAKEITKNLNLHGEICQLTYFIPELSVIITNFNYITPCECVKTMIIDYKKDTKIEIEGFKEYTNEAKGIFMNRFRENQDKFIQS